MGKILYLECNSGISGDMTVGALLDLGANKEVLISALESLGVDGYHLHFGRTSKCGLDAYDFDVHLENDVEKEHSHEQEHSHGHEHSHEQEHNHNHNQDHVHRSLSDIYPIIDKLKSGDRVKKLSKRMFEIVADAESKAHGIPVEDVHFHEVGAIDSIVDIISTAICIDNLGIEEVVVSSLAEGFGCVRCQHGIIPVPVPATANIALAYGLNLRFMDVEGEMVTPTGAAIAAALKTRNKLPASCQILKIGMGAGKKEFKQANVLRAMILEESEEENEKRWVLEANVDDSSGEMLGLAMESLLEAGAADVWNTPVYMKKNRPAYMISVICGEEEISKMEEILFLHTTTIGVRRYPVSRTVMGRNEKKVMTKYGEANVKICTYKDQVFVYPEYESIRNLCRQSGKDYQEVYANIREEAKHCGTE
ncbi:nickel pincer cofactor biosynthesis protein LarC [Clostridium sp. E02]|uniref:nickel pincer cofactor biosynthesis protein LarC n=1 Tax=Clostridium sp. E02 TaxID=2487134 RepID=UPI000F53F826|nr:nickel pincer cofactor biosynthesis protein LarC [Clostridium sp. E02]